MGSLDDQQREAAEAEYAELIAQILAALPGADTDDLIYNKLGERKIANTKGIPLSRFSVFTRVKGARAVLEDL